ncbi:hypothetical protein B0H17DRAFT_1128773 [Mycena rosella]|uniref:Uncharacterized protein n=1 Tax=Mycena rosella TaxID=1033263 RepID=A0AAD7GLB1_MYCRO|nr:hypothetical protein B0H17DRAFT_1128773 [Mycena rosella]
MRQVEGRERANRALGWYGGGWRRGYVRLGPADATWALNALWAGLKRTIMGISRLVENFNLIHTGSEIQTDHALAPLRQRLAFTETADFGLSFLGGATEIWPHPRSSYSEDALLTPRCASEREFLAMSSKNRHGVSLSATAASAGQPNFDTPPIATLGLWIKIHRDQSQGLLNTVDWLIVHKNIRDLLVSANYTLSRGRLLEVER